MMTATSPSPTSWRPTITTLAALTIASAAASAATYPFVSIMPSAFCAIVVSSPADLVPSSLLRDGLGLLGRRRLRPRWRWLVNRADDQRIDGRPIRQPARRDRTLDDEHSLALANAEDVKGDQALARAGHLDLQERATGQSVDPLGGPDVPYDNSLQHHRSLSIGTPSDSARSRASGVSTARRPRTSRSPALAAACTARSVTAPVSIRNAPCPGWLPGTWLPGDPDSVNRRRPVSRSRRRAGLSASRTTVSTKLCRSSSVARRTCLVPGGTAGSPAGRPACWIAPAGISVGGAAGSACGCCAEVLPSQGTGVAGRPPLGQMEAGGGFR